MKRTTPTLPLGIDVGSARVRVALAQRTADGANQLVAVAVRPRGDNLGDLIADAVAELRTRERRCVLGVGEPVAVLRAATFPPMGPRELERAARYEARRFVDFPIDEAHVRVVALDAARRESAIGVVRKDVLAERRYAVQAAKLRLIAVDNNALAIRRTLPDSDAVLDIGQDVALLHVYGQSLPRTYRFAIGGATFTRAIVDAFGTDLITAERRKLAHGIAGSGEDLRDQLVERIASALADARASGYGDVRVVALVGNGARLDDLPAIIERVCAVRVTLATLPPAVSTTLPPDVLRAAAPDWCQAYGLALWAAA